MYTYPFQILKNKLQAKVAELKDIDWFMNQYSKTDKSSMLYDLPGVYIQFLPIDPDQAGMQTQLGVAQFDIHLVTSNLLEKGSDRIKKTEAKDHALIMDKVYKYINGKRGKLHEADGMSGLIDTPQDYLMMNTMTRKRITPPHELKANMVSIQRFECVIYDYAANKTFQNIVADLEVNSE